jgi:predicted nucleotidyltransferase component of viral defense system
MTMNLQLGHIARHTPQGAGAQGREAAVIDVAQDLLLSYLHKRGTLDSLAIKGGTAIRKLYAGKEGRFSLDLDFSYTDIDADEASATLEFISALEGLQIASFRYGIEERRGKWTLTFDSPFVAGQTLKSKLDFSAPSWLDPIKRGWKPMPVHKQYGGFLPEISTVRLEENIAEKIARLNRTTPARDMYDLTWVMTTPAIASNLDISLIRQLAVLKIWVDANGMHGGKTFWKQGHQAFAFDPEYWLRERDKEDFDPEDIGALAVPTPTAKQLSDSIRKHYTFLTDLDERERIIARADERDRSLVIKTLKSLSTSRFEGIELY